MDAQLSRLTAPERAAARSLTQLIADPWRDPSAAMVDSAVQDVYDAVSRDRVCQIVGKTALCARLRRPGSTLATELATASARACTAP